MKIRIEEDLNREEILEFIADLDGSTFFHTPAWMEAIRASFPRLEAGWVTARTAGGLAGLMPFVRKVRGPLFSLWSMPFGTYGTPLEREAGVSMELLKKFFQISSSPACLEGVANIFGSSFDDLRLRGTRRRIESCCIIELSGEFEDYSDKVLGRRKKRECLATARDGVVARPLATMDELAVFHGIYRDASRNWGGVHPYPLRFFEELYGRRDEGVLFLGAFRGGRLLGGHIDMFFGRNAQAWQAGMASEARRYKLASFLVYSAVREAYGRGARIFNLGSSGGDMGLIRFKQLMGGKEYNYPVIEKRKCWWGWIRPR